MSPQAHSLNTWSPFGKAEPLGVEPDGGSGHQRWAFETIAGPVVLALASVQSSHCACFTVRD